MNLAFRRHRTSLVLFCLFLSAAAHAIAQDARVETQQQINERNQNTIGNQPVAFAPTDPELGDISLVSRQQRPKMFSFWTTQSLNYTSNAFLARDNIQDAFFWNGRLGASIIPYATRDFTPRISFEQNFFRYDHLDALEFDSQTLTFDVKYRLNHNDNWFINGSYALSRLYSPQSSIGEFYKYGLLSGSITHLMQAGPIYLALTGGTYWRAGEPSSSDRIALYSNVVAIYNIREELQLAGFVRPELQFYTNDPVKSSRKDVNATVGAILSWAPCPYVTLATTASYIGNFSSLGQRRYNVVLPSLIVAAQISF